MGALDRLSKIGGAANLDSGAMLALPAPGPKRSTALVQWMPPLTQDEYKVSPTYMRPLMRPPTTVMLPLRGFACDCEAWKGSKSRWVVESSGRSECENVKCRSEKGQT